ncbi:hypothetical protein Btru_059463 [Bulinus truncatus]|nr:hypothetical protein Btru_059463 [Bulinus truncatus]
MIPLQVSEIAAAYREVISYPNPTAAYISSNDGGKTVLLQSKWTQRDIERKEKVSLLISHVIDSDTGKVLSHCGPQEIKFETWSKSSPSGKLKAVIKQLKDKKNEDRQYLEIYDNNRKLKSFDLFAMEKHGKIIENDGQFGSFEWSQSESHLLYIAEKKKTKSGSFFSAKGFQDKSSDEQIQIGDEFVYSETWGEQLTECIQPVVCILEIGSGVVNILDSLPSNESPGQAMWAPDDAGVVISSWKNEPYKLGLKFCCQRRSSLYYLDIQKSSYEILSETGHAVRFPRFSPDMSKLVYFDVPEGGAHNQCARLLKIDWLSRRRDVVVDEVSYATAPDFPGIYFSDLARHIWFDDNVHLALATSWRSSTAVIVVNTETGDVKRIHEKSFKRDIGSLGLLGVQNNFLILFYSTLGQPFELILGKVTSPKSPESISWIYPYGSLEKLDWLTFSVFQHKPDSSKKHPIYDSLDYESILCLPKKDKDTASPLIVFTHGGPNAVFDISFNIIPSFFCKCGYAVLMVNYRGSIGFGQDSIISLTGSIGVQDVKDVESAMLEILDKKLVDDKHIFKFGGSHGGFLTLHMIGQYPDMFKAAATRNPVVNLTTMQSATDIPDWIFAQCGLPFVYSTPADGLILPQLWSRSPIAYIDQIKTPVLLMIGQEDKRVPPSQGNELYRALKAKGVPVRYLTYPGNNHSIADVEAEADCMKFVSTILSENVFHFSIINQFINQIL